MKGIEDREVCPECGKPPRHAARCSQCFYTLQGLAQQGQCPECGREYDLANERSFTRRPPFMPLAFWMPFVLFSLVLTLLVFGICVFMFKSWNAALWVATPICAGSLIGYRGRSAGVSRVMAVVGIIGALVLLAAGMTMGGVGGVFCFLVLIVIMLFPIMFGVLLGLALRSLLKRHGYRQATWLPALGVLAITFVVIVAGGRTAPMPVETVRTGTTIRASTDAAWRSIMYYEEVRHDPPLILRIGLARPLLAQGRSDRVGDVKTCIYNKGYLSKRTTAVKPGEMLAFEVIGQQIGYEHDVRLRSGAFEFEPAGENQTRVTLSTTYEPLLSPRWVWRPFERYAVHTLHGHVLEGMRREAEQTDAAGVLAGAVP
jgi:RNA polymerase subunit RPABC4/transcription elongation factor Spt4